MKTSNDIDRLAKAIRTDIREVHKSCITIALGLNTTLLILNQLGPKGRQEDWYCT
jgi:hypothetical protein